MSVVKFNEEVYYSGDQIVAVSTEDIEELKRLASMTARRRSRLCTHRHVDDLVHEMLIIHEKDTYIRPKKHMRRGKSYHLIEGEMDIIVFQDDGAIVHVIEMGVFRSGKVFYVRVDEPQYHTVLVRSHVAVFHETKCGPFRKEETIFAPWAPEETDTQAANLFVNRLHALLDGGQWHRFHGTFTG